MKIFLADRCIEFLSSQPADSCMQDLVVEFKSTQLLSDAWKDFRRYEKFRRLLIVDHDYNSPSLSSSVTAFFSFFILIEAAGGIVRNEKGEYLFIHRLGLWDLPKGKIDKKDKTEAGKGASPTETQRVAALREVREETGIRHVEIIRALPSTWHIYSSKEKWYLKKTGWFEMKADSSETLKPQTSEGIFMVKWTSPKAIHCILPHTYASIRELLLEILF